MVSKFLKIIVSSIVGFIVFLIIIIVGLCSLVANAFSDDEINNSESDEVYGKVVYNAKYTVMGWCFPVGDCSYANINNKHYPSYVGHTGVDINIGVTGKPVLAVADGRVIISMAKKNIFGNYVSYGEYVAIQHQMEDGSSLITYYCHMSPNSRLVNAGDTVVAGQQIGIVGTTGNSTGVHLHFEVRENGHPINPLPFLESIVDSDEINSDTDIRDDSNE